MREDGRGRGFHGGMVAGEGDLRQGDVGSGGEENGFPPPTFAGASSRREDNGSGDRCILPIFILPPIIFLPRVVESRLLTDEEAVSSKAGLGGFFCQVGQKQQSITFIAGFLEDRCRI